MASLRRGRVGGFGFLFRAGAGRRNSWFWIVGDWIGDGIGRRFLIAKPAAAAGDGDDLGVVQEAVEDRRRAWYVADQLTPIFQRAVAGHHRRAGFVASYDDLEQHFS